MDETFMIPVNFKQKELEFEARLIVTGYTYKIVANVYGTEVSFEPDEERNFRAILDPAKADRMKSDDVELLKAIASSLEAIVND